MVLRAFLAKRESSGDAARWKRQFKGSIGPYHPCDIVIAFEVTVRRSLALLRSSAIRMVLTNFVTRART
ncbi:hypothetical protein HZH68_007214 [Vespula germanica]|uniref:Uncharacterized protein n=1 Tax=Vespula germanica TaxID=30212 RepID=A0A834K6I4_VESGE|nr:hypothetical protein HZH68_007214 [Vespula germanica]